ncbi:hypothetical protein [Ancylobacter novellus]|uniref:hypothetical protein n=1 Tax=Ancylobacter novellus TaxID=921 RepID=UPI001184E640|nr:hypothetical protein [Ancylobacter novellus]
MAVLTPADMNASIAVAIGRFSQACCYMESQLHFLLSRLLPLTTDMGRVLLAGNQLRRNTEILAALLRLPEIPISTGERERLSKLPPRLKSINDDRSRFLHNPMMGGMVLDPEKGEEQLLLAVARQDGGSAVHPISVELINKLVEEARALCSELYTAPIEYDLSTWGKAFPQFALKPYPTNPKPKPGSRKDRRQNGRTAPEARDTNPKSEGEQPR